MYHIHHLNFLCVYLYFDLKYRCVWTYNKNTNTCERRVTDLNIYIEQTESHISCCFILLVTDIFSKIVAYDFKKTKDFFMKIQINLFSRKIRYLSVLEPVVMYRTVGWI